MLQGKGRINLVWEEIPIPVDVLDQLVDRYLPGRVRGWCEFERQQEHGHIVYKLRQWQRGDIGALELRKTGENLSSMIVRDPVRQAGETDEEHMARTECGHKRSRAVIDWMQADPAWMRLAGQAQQWRPVMQESDNHADSGHYKYPPETRRQIVEEYRRLRQRGEVLNKDAWARAKWDISGRTLLSYEREFPETEV